MSVAPKIIQCPKCGHKLAIPPGYENVPGKCRTCGTIINADARRLSQKPDASPGQQPGKDLLDAALLSEGIDPELGKKLLDLEDAPAHPGAVGSPKKQPFEARPAPDHRKGAAPAPRDPMPISRVVLWAAIWGLVGALAAGTANVVVMRVFGRSHDLATFKSIFATADTGILLGGVLGALTSIVHNRKLELIAGTVVGGVISLALGVFFYLVEWAFIAPSDTSLWANAFIFLLGGAVAGAVLSNVIEMLS